MQATMTVIGLYSVDNTILDGIVLPEGMDLETLKTNLIDEIADLEIAYPSLPYFKNLVTVWAKKEFAVWQRQYDTVTIKYDMLKNYDITITDHHDNIVTSTGSNKNEMHNTNKGSDVTTNKVVGFNSDTLKTNGESNVTLGTGSDSNGSASGSSSGTDKGDILRHEYGDASLRTTQEVLKLEREVALYNVYDLIIQSFKNRFCLLVY